jgi:hypothetical protein
MVALALFILVAEVAIPASAHTASASEASAASCPPVATTPDYTIAYGAVLLDGVAAPVGTVVEALNPRDDVVGCFEIWSEGRYGYMSIFGEDDSGNPIIPGMRTGATVAFRVGGYPATATDPLIWASDRWPHSVDLAASSTPTAVGCYALDLGSSPPASGSVDADPPLGCAQGSVPGEYFAGAQVEIQASPLFGHRFSHWSGDARGNANPITLIMDRDRTFIAHFTPVETYDIHMPLVLRAP